MRYLIIVLCFILITAAMAYCLSIGKSGVRVNQGLSVGQPSISVNQGGEYTPPTPSTDALLLENDDYLLLENDDKLLLE